MWCGMVCELGVVLWYAVRCVFLVVCMVCHVSGVLCVWCDFCVW